MVIFKPAPHNEHGVFKPDSVQTVLTIFMINDIDIYELAKIATGLSVFKNKTILRLLLVCIFILVFCKI